jgi:hypothetical protein
MIIVFEHIIDAGQRLSEAQVILKKSIEMLGLEAILFPGGKSYAKFRDILEYGRSCCTGPAFVWCNSDVILRRNPYELANDGWVHGFHRTEVPSGEVTFGVDMYLIPCSVWDNYLSKDIPDLYCGTSFVDWWITRAAQKTGIYENHTGYIDHVSHEKSSAASSMQNKYYRHNLREYNAWARRNGVGGVDVPISLPGPLAKISQWFS